MSLVFCPECGHEVSAAAIACPNCGLPLSAVEVPVAVVEKTPPPRRVVREKLPPWAIGVMGLLGVGLLFTLIFLASSGDDETNTNVAVNAARRADTTASSQRETRTTEIASSQPPSVSIPDTSTSTTATTVPSTTTTSIPSTSAPVSVPAAPPDRSKVVIKAKVMPPRGSERPARGAKFYLLDKDIESILSRADLEPIDGNTLVGSLGLAAVFPDRYGDFQRAAMRAIAAHIKYSGSTDASGTASLGASIKPDQYYIFSIMRSGDGFAMWNAPVTVTPGENILDLGAQPITELVADSDAE